MAYILNKALILRRSAFYKNIISGSINKNTLMNHQEHLTNKTNSLAEKKYKLKDNISNDYQLVYREHSTINTVVVGAYHIGWLGLVAGTLSIGYLIYKNPPVREKGSEEVLDGRVLRPLTSLERVLMLLASFAVSIILIVSSRTIPIRIYHSPTEKVYKAVFVNRIFGKKQMETFSEGGAVPVFSRKSPGDLLFNINGRIVLLDKECFPVPYVRERMIRKKT